MSAQSRELDLFLKFDEDAQGLVLNTWFDTSATRDDPGNEGDSVLPTPERLEEIKALVQDKSMLHIEHDDELGIDMFWVAPDPSTRIYIDDRVMAQFRANSI